MKKLWTVSILILVLGCKVTEKPELLKVDSVKVIQANKKGIKIKTDILFLNKNNIGGTLQAKDIRVLVDSMDVANVKTTPFKVPKKDTFVLPLTVTVPYDKVFNDNKQNLLSSIMNVISNKKIHITYVGEIRYSIGDFHYDYPLNFTQELSIK